MYKYLFCLSGVATKGKLGALLRLLLHLLLRLLLRLLRFLAENKIVKR